MVESRSDEDAGRSATPAPADRVDLRPTTLELASGRMYGEGDPPVVPPSRYEDHRGNPLAALAAAIVPALERPPCFVSFSGGRDSAGVLAAATWAARHAGLAPPVPITLRVSGLSLGEELAWQDQVVRHLDLREWEIREVGNGLDRLGPLAQPVIKRHGSLYPPNSFLLVPGLEVARGGSLLTGYGGDQIFATWRWRDHAELLARRRRAAPRDLMRLGYLAAPRWVRARRELRRWRDSQHLGWLTPGANEQVAKLGSRDVAGEPRTWPHWVDWLSHRRELAAAQWSMSRLAADADALVLHPLLDQRFLREAARAGGRFGPGNRTAAMRAIFADVLPDGLLSRRTKGTYNDAFWGPYSRQFAAAWNGAGIDADLVDPVALRSEWLSPHPHGNSAMLLQAAWLSEHG